ncbi:hypothetical protein DFJ58DRAFT_746026 [Suillus subalutaceus]|uniref:uncharacterized protein n=1 Tax=Suillus subalutaceus TaxID=48586 RepID=UPI001B866FB5|nr:uncharacterized protein DFJ58DRAFT_746026 [Suillus subalutaceus]KAG1852883.1 hypothetical protein DFJ58DRAFT_746026 [Suillus subalutaceus]
MAPTTYRSDRTVLKIVTTEKKGREAALDPVKIPQLANAIPEINLQEAPMEKDIPVSRSRRTLREILSLLCRNLKSYTINKVWPGVWGQPANVKYCLQTPTLEDLVKEMETLKIQVGTLQARQEAQKATMTKRQVAKDIFQALGEIAWTQISAERKFDLASTKDINNFTELYYNFRADTVTMAAYQSVSPEVRRFVDAAIVLKREVKGDQGHVAHPDISMACLQEVLDKLGINGVLRDQLISDVQTEA